MQNLSMPAPQLPLPANATASGAPVTVNATINDTPGAGNFSRMLARELAGKTHEHEPGGESLDATTAAPLPDNGTLPLPSDQDSTTTALPVLTPGIQLGEVVPDYLQQISGEMPPTALSSQIANETLLGALSNQVAGEALLGALSNQVAGEAPAAARSGQIVNGTLLGALSNQTPGGMPLAASSNPVLGGVALAALQIGASGQRNLSQGTHPIKPASGLDDTTPESDKTANFAAFDKFLPPVAAGDRIFRAVTQLLAQDSTGATPSPQTGISSTVAAASLIPGSSSIDQNQNPRLDARVGTPGWDGALAQKVVWMVTQQQQVAQLQLNPPNLGPMEVMLTVGNGPDPQTRIEFTSPHLAVREAIQAALPHLREMMADNGISLGSATVSADSFQQQAQAGRQDHASPKQAGDMPQTASELATRSAATRVHTGLVDTFA